MSGRGSRGPKASNRATQRPPGREFTRPAPPPAEGVPDHDQGMLREIEVAERNRPKGIEDTLLPEGAVVYGHLHCVEFGAAYGVDRWFLHFKIDDDGLDGTHRGGLMLCAYRAPARRRLGRTSRLRQEYEAVTGRPFAALPQAAVEHTKPKERHRQVRRWLGLWLSEVEVELLTGRSRTEGTPYSVVRRIVRVSTGTPKINRILPKPEGS